MPLGPTPIWDDPATIDQLQRLAAEPTLTLVIGAGASAEVGFPLWGTLVKRLVAAGVANRFSIIKDSEKQAVAESIVDLGPTAAASYAKTLLGQKFDYELSRSLYGEVDTPNLAGPTSTAVARLYAELSAESELVTMNYDDQLHIALSKHLGPSSVVKSLTAPRKRQTAESIIRHIHGKAHPGEGSTRLVLTEADYFSTDAKSRWGADFMKARLRDSAALFIGTSLSDPNLLKYLYTQSDVGTPRHLAVFRRASHSSSAPAVRSFENATAAKWNEVGVATMQNDFYSQNAQFLHELRLIRTLKEAYVPYAERLGRWTLGMQDWLHNESSDALFQDNQRVVQEALVNLVESIVTVCGENNIHLKADETLNAELWSRRPSTRQLRLLGSSAKIYRQTSSVPAVSLLEDDSNPVVACFQTGVSTLNEIESRSSQTKTMMTIPVVLDDHPDYARLPVGILVLTSNHRRSLSIIDRVPTGPPTIGALLDGPGSHASNLLDPRVGLAR
jgi:hypothetical protein